MADIAPATMWRSRTLGATDMVELVAVQAFDHRAMVKHPTVVLDARAEFALDILRESGVGTSLNPQSTAARACETAAAAFAEFERRGWITAVPCYADCAPTPATSDNG